MVYFSIHLGRPIYHTHPLDATPPAPGGQALTWVIVRTGTGKPSYIFKAYEAVAVIAADAWLPETLRVIRNREGTEARREVWGPVLPGMFFAKLTPHQIATALPTIRHSRGVVRDAGGMPLVVDAKALTAFRKAIMIENAQRARQAKLHRERPIVGNRTKIKRSRRIRPARQAEAIRKWANAMIKTTRADGDG